MKTNYIISFILLLGVFFASCDGTVGKSTNGSGRKSESYNLVVENIDSMGSKPWNKSVYENIRDNQISELKRETEKTSASEYLKATYGKVLVSEANNILNSGCTSNTHDYLNKVITELKGFAETPGYSEVIRQKNIHDEGQTFANKGIPRQTVKSYRDDYDESYEKTNIRKANSYLENKSLKCKVTRDKLERLTKSSEYYGRRKNYCESIVECYLECTDPAKRELNAALGKLNTFRGDSRIKDEWESKMREHYDSLQPK